VTASGVSAANVVATIEVPASHQLTLRPPTKNLLGRGGRAPACSRSSDADVGRRRRPPPPASSSRRQEATLSPRRTSRGSRQGLPLLDLRASQAAVNRRRRARATALLRHAARPLGVRAKAEPIARLSRRPAWVSLRLAAALRQPTGALGRVLRHGAPLDVEDARHPAAPLVLVSAVSQPRRNRRERPRVVLGARPGLCSNARARPAAAHTKKPSPTGLAFALVGDAQDLGFRRSAPRRACARSNASQVGAFGQERRHVLVANHVAVVRVRRARALGAATPAAVPARRHALRVGEIGVCPERAQRGGGGDLAIARDDRERRLPGHGVLGRRVALLRRGRAGVDVGAFRDQQADRGVSLALRAAEWSGVHPLGPGRPALEPWPEAAEGCSRRPTRSTPGLVQRRTTGMKPSRDRHLSLEQQRDPSPFSPPSVVSATCSGELAGTVDAVRIRARTRAAGLSTSRWRCLIAIVSADSFG
jgi:hypothetical protein